MLYYIGKILLAVFFKLFCRIKFIDQQKIPTTGGLIVASNHVSYYDPFAVGSGLNRKIRWMAKKELFEEKLVGFLISIMAAFPVERGKGDLKAVKQAVKFLKSGEIIGIFPEGTRSVDGTVGEPQQGLGLISVMSGAPVTPAAIVGTLNARIKSGIVPKFRQIVVKYGEAIYPDKIEGTKKEKIDTITRMTIESIRKLKEELQTEWEP